MYLGFDKKIWSSFQHW